jgi:hypothetical protein
MKTVLKDTNFNPCQIRDEEYDNVLPGQGYHILRHILVRKL